MLQSSWENGHTGASTALPAKWREAWGGGGARARAMRGEERTGARTHRLSSKMSRTERPLMVRAALSYTPGCCRLGLSWGTLKKSRNMVLLASL